MSDTGYPVFYAQPGAKVDAFRITGASVGAVQGSAGLDGRGQSFCTIAKSTNVQTLVFKRSLPDDPYVFLTALTANAGYTLAFTHSADMTTGMTITGLERDDNTTPINNIDWQVVVHSFSTKSFIL